MLTGEGRSPPPPSFVSNFRNLMLPSVVILSIAWTLLFAARYVLGIPPGPRSPAHLH
jgi:p-aminobenzoyl-glutamate transporter AbgT